MIHILKGKWEAQLARMSRVMDDGEIQFNFDALNKLESRGALSIENENEIINKEPESVR